MSITKTYYLIHLLTRSHCNTNSFLNFLLLQKMIKVMSFIIFIPFYLFEDGPFIVRDLLSSWHQKNVCWLEKVEVHRETSRNVRVTVMPFYMGSKVSLRYLYTL